MVLKAKIYVSEDSFSEYLDYIYDSFHEHKVDELKRQARILTGEYDTTDAYIPRNMAVGKYNEFNPNLHLSGQEEEYWKISSKSNPHNLMGGSNLTSLEILYTGMRLHENYGDDARVWWEFAKGYEGDPNERELGRDYAYYQETGIDKVAKPKNARAKGAIAMGVKQGSDEVLKHSKNYLHSIMRRGDGGGKLSFK